MKIRIRHGFALLFVCALPLEVVVPPEDGSETNLGLGWSAGHYAIIARGCDGSIISKRQASFQELNFSLDHKFASPIRLGVRSYFKKAKRESDTEYYWNSINGTSRFVDQCQDERHVFINPFFQAEWKWFAIGLGPVWSIEKNGQASLSNGDTHFDPRCSGYLRIGPPKLFYWDLSILPSYVSGVLTGFGGMVSHDVNLWLGVGGGVQDKAGFVCKSDIRLYSDLYLNVMTRLGISEGVSENAIHLGLTYRHAGKRL